MGERGGEFTYGVTLSLETKYRKPVPYGVPLVGRGKIVRETRNFLTAECCIMDENRTVLANATIKYIKLTPQQIQAGIDEHEEMCYLIEDGVEQIDLPA